MRESVAALALACLFLVASSATAQEQMMESSTAQLAVAEAVVATQIADRQPVDNVTTVPADVGQVYCWTRIVGAEAETEVVHVWYRGDMEMARVSLRVAGNNWRTWSSKRIEPSWTGEWRVDVEAPDGTVLESVTFSVG